jgi:hypothetical protein
MSLADVLPPKLVSLDDNGHKEAMVSGGIEERWEAAGAGSGEMSEIPITRHQSS